MKRIDKYLWAVRVFKTRSIATEACKKGRVLIEGTTVKPSREVKVEDVINVKKNRIIYTYRVIEPIEKRVSAKLATEYVEDITPQEELDKLQIDKYADFFVRERGAGRPTKKERRNIDKLFDNQ